MSKLVDMVLELTIKPLYQKELKMVNALNSSSITLKNSAMDAEAIKAKKLDSAEVTKEEESKIDKLKKSIQGGSYKLDMEKTAKALVEF